MEEEEKQVVSQTERVTQVPPTCMFNSKILLSHARQIIAQPAAADEEEEDFLFDKAVASPAADLTANELEKTI